MKATSIQRQPNNLETDRLSSKSRATSVTNFKTPSTIEHFPHQHNARNTQHNQAKENKNNHHHFRFPMRCDAICERESPTNSQLSLNFSFQVIYTHYVTRMYHSSSSSWLLLMWKCDCVEWNWNWRWRRRRATKWGKWTNINLSKGLVIFGRK